MSKVVYKYPLGYKGNTLWPLVFLFIYPPLGILLLLLNGYFIKNNMQYYLNYKGSIFWLGFWMLLFFPIAIILAIVNGFDIIEVTEE